MNYLIRLRDGEEEHLVNTVMIIDGQILSFFLEDLQYTIHFPMVNVLSVKEFESTNIYKQTTKYV